MPNKENSVKTESALLMMKVLGDRLNGLSEDEIAFVQASMVESLDKVKGEAKERAAWKPLNDEVKAVFVKHGKLSVVTGKAYRLDFDDEGRVSAFRIIKRRASTGESASGKLKQYRKKRTQGDEKEYAWITTPTWADACNQLSLAVNGDSAKRVLVKNGYETRVIDAPKGGGA